MVDKERMRPGRWLGLVLYVLFIALMLTVGWQEGHLAHRILNPLILGHSGLEQVVEEDPRRNQLTQVHLEKHSLYGTSSSSSTLVLLLKPLY